MRVRFVPRHSRCWTLALALVLTLASGCDSDRPPVAGDAPPRTATIDPARPPLLRLDAEAIRRAGVELARVSAAIAEPEITAYGRVLDPIPIVDALANVEAAKSADDAADRQLRRVEAMARNAQNASARDAELARAAAVRARSDLSMAESRLIGLLGSELANSPDLPAMVRRFARREAVLIRIDVPGNTDDPIPDPGSRLSIYPRTGVESAARFLGRAPTSDPALPGTGFLYSLNDSTPPVGTPIQARLLSAGQVRDGVSIPAAAVLRYGDGLFVFVASGEGRFERRGIKASTAQSGRFFVREGLSVGERVVVSGASQLLSEELLSADPDASL